MRWRWVGLLGCCVALGAGCGGSGPSPDERAAAETVRTYMHALMSGDAATACAQFTAASRRKIAAEATQQARSANPNAPARTCAQAYDWVAKTFQRTLPKGTTPDRAAAELRFDVKIDGDVATVKIRGDRQSGQLRREGGRWRMVD